MKAFYSQSTAIIGECVDVQFKDRSTPIKFSSHYMREGVIASGWKVTVDDCNQVWIVSTIISVTFTFLFFR